MALAAILIASCDGKRQRDTHSPTQPLDTSSAPKPVTSTPIGVKIRWEVDWKPPKIGKDADPPSITIDNLPGVRGELRCAGLKCLLRIHGLPERTRVNIGDTETSVSSTLDYRGEIDVGDAVAAAPENLPTPQVSQSRVSSVQLYEIPGFSS